MIVDWQHISESLEEGFAAPMRGVLQSQKWHGEGDVYTHTMMVREALEGMPEYGCLSEQQRHILQISALLHDVGKIFTTRIEMGRISAPHHALVGARVARELLWKTFGLCGSKEAIRIREAICLLIRYHSFPPHAIDAEDACLRLHRIASNGLLVPDFSLRLLCLLAQTDMLGRKCDDRQFMLDQISLCEELSREEGCFESCYPFPSMRTQHIYLSGGGVWKEQDLYDDTWGEVIMMSGLPGTGKDTWIGRNLPDLPMISLDEIRRANKISPTEDQGLVANIAREQAKEYLRGHQSFVWNATNLTSQLRQSLITLFQTYKARVRIVYLETDWKTQLERNANRECRVPQSVIEGMLCKLTLPEPFEADKVEWICT